MVMLNDLDRFHLVMDVIDRVDGLASRAAVLRQRMVDARLAAPLGASEHGGDGAAIANWIWDTRQDVIEPAYGRPCGGFGAVSAVGAVTADSCAGSTGTTVVQVASVLSVNVARVRTNPDPRALSKVTGIDKVAATEPIMVRAPRADARWCGQWTGRRTPSATRSSTAVTTRPSTFYAREDLDAWEIQLKRTLANGNFGENLTTSGIDVTAARIGERCAHRRRRPALEVSAPRTPCRTFQAFLI